MGRAWGQAGTVDKTSGRGLRYTETAVEVFLAYVTGTTQRVAAWIRHTCATGAIYQATLPESAEETIVTTLTHTDRPGER